MCREPAHGAADESGPALSKIATISALTAITVAVTASSECADDPQWARAPFVALLRGVTYACMQRVTETSVHVLIRPGQRCCAPRESAQGLQCWVQKKHYQ